MMTGLAGAGLGLAWTDRAWAMTGDAAHGAHAGGNAMGTPAATLSGELIELTVDSAPVKVGGRRGHAITVNGTTPGPLIRLREGQRVCLRVHNRLDEDTSIHWHGLLVPFQFDGVPGISYPGIAPGQTFDHVFTVRQAGTYWYHGHSNMQEAMGLFGPIVIDPAGGREAEPHDREHTILLHDWSDVHPHVMLKRLKQQGGFYNRQQQTLAGLLAGRDQPLRERLDWGRMRMDPTDIADVTGSTYTYCINGHDSAANWTGLYTPGERVRLRVINAAAMTNFNLRVPGLPMRVVAADGQDVVPVETDEFQIGIAETLDVIVQPSDGDGQKNQVFAIVAEAIDRSGQCRATLAPVSAPGLVAPIPPRRARPILTMRDMGMGGMDMTGMDMASGTLDLSAPAAPMAHGHHGGMTMRDKSLAPPGMRLGPGVATIAAAPVDRLADRPTGLEDVDHRVVTYADLKARVPRPQAPPTRSLEVHLTANMERYMWSFDGVKLSENPAPLAFRAGERVRVTLVNDTMMPHPIHLHGHFFDLVNGAGEAAPRKHTVNVLPGGKASFDLTADAVGDWAFHCHMLLHMHAGMFRVVTVREAAA